MNMVKYLRLLAWIAAVLTLSAPALGGSFFRCTFVSPNYSGCSGEVFLTPDNQPWFTFPYSSSEISETSCALCSTIVYSRLIQEDEAIHYPDLPQVGECYPPWWCELVLGIPNKPIPPQYYPPECDPPGGHPARPEDLMAAYEPTRVHLESEPWVSVYVLMAVHEDFGVECGAFHTEQMKKYGLTCEKAQAVAYVAMDQHGTIGRNHRETALGLADDLMSLIRGPIPGRGPTPEVYISSPRGNLRSSVHLAVEVEHKGKILGMAWANIPEYGARRSFFDGPYPVLVTRTTEDDPTARPDQFGRLWSTQRAPDAFLQAGIRIKPGPGYFRDTGRETVAQAF